MEDLCDKCYADRALLDQWKTESMLEQASKLHDDMRRLDPANAGRDHLTFFQRPYAAEQSLDFVKKAPVWFTAYLPSLIADEPPLRALSDPELLKHLTELQVSGIHTGPVMLAGGYSAGHVDPTGTQSGDKVEPDDTADGWFDPIQLAVDPKFGTEEDYQRLVEEATKKREILIVGDIVPGHTGRGRDFHLALRDFEHYPGVFLMVRADETLDGYLAQTRVENNVRLFSRLREDEKQRREISEAEFTALREEIASPIADGELSRFLSENAIAALTKLQIIPGMPQRTLGPQAGFGWSVTREFFVESAKGVTNASIPKERRRWIYLHFFDYRQPTLNWMDPSFAAWRIITGQLNYVIWKLGSGAVRLDANSFLGLEKIVETNLPEQKKGYKPWSTWSEAHPLSKMATNMLSWQARRLGGFSFQEMNMGLQDYADSANVGPDLSYDFVTRPACEHALLTGNTEFLNIVYLEMAKYKVNPGRLIHALQNHDDLTFELVHFRDRGADEFFDFGTEKMPGWTPENEKVEEANDKAERDSFDSQVRQEDLQGGAPASTAALTSVWRKVRSELRTKARKDNTYNAESGNGLCTTFAGLIAAGLGCRDLEEAKQKVDQICRGHLLLAAFNAWQPGVFAFSGWDVVGAFPVEHGPKGEETEDMRIVQEVEGHPRRDYRWRNRGAYRLLNKSGLETPAYDAAKQYGCLSLQEAYPLYGSLEAQMDPNSLKTGNFCKGLQDILRARGQHRIFAGEFGGVLDLADSSLFGMLTWLDDGSRAAIAIFNFDPIDTKYAMVRPHRSQGWIERHQDKKSEKVEFSRKKMRIHSNAADAGISFGEPIELKGWEYKMFILSDL